MDDRLSSPDPLNDDTCPPSINIKRSSRARQSSFPTSSTPKRRTFQLDVGNEISPHRIRVTVQAEDSNIVNKYTRVNNILSSPSRQAVSQKEKAAARSNAKRNHLESRGFIPNGETPKSEKGRPKKTVAPTSSKKRGRAPSKKAKEGSVTKSFEPNGLNDETDVQYLSGSGGESTKRVRSTLKSVNEVTRVNSPAIKLDDMNKMLSGTKARRRKSLKKTVESPTITHENRTAYLEFDQSNNNEINELFQSLDQNNDTNTARASSNNIASYISERLRNQDSDAMFRPYDTEIEPFRKEKYPRPYLVERSNSYPRSEVNQYPSPYSPTKLDSQNIEDTALHVEKELHNKTVEGKLESKDENRFLEENLAKEPREFDSILESEGFSLISADSIISLQENIKKAKKNIDQSLIDRAENFEHLAIQNKNQKNLPRAQDLGISNEAKTTKKAFHLDDLRSQTTRNSDYLTNRIASAYQKASTNLDLHSSQLSGKINLRDHDSLSLTVPQASLKSLPLAGLNKSQDKAAISQSIEIYEDSNLASTSTFQGVKPSSIHTSEISKAQLYSSSNLNEPFRESPFSEEDHPPINQSQKNESSYRAYEALKDLSKSSPRDSQAFQIFSPPPLVMSQEVATYLETHQSLDLNISQTETTKPLSPSFRVNNSSRGDSSNQSLLESLTRDRTREKALLSSTPTQNSGRLGTSLISKSVKLGPKSKLVREASPILRLDQNKYLPDSVSQRQKSANSHERFLGNRQQLAANTSSLLSQAQKQLNISPHDRKYSSSRNEDVKPTLSYDKINIYTGSEYDKAAEKASDLRDNDNIDLDFQKSKNVNFTDTNIINSKEDSEDEDFELLLETLNHASHASSEDQESNTNDEEPLSPYNSSSVGQKQTRSLVQSDKLTKMESISFSKEVDETSEAAIRYLSTPSIVDRSRDRESKNDHFFEDRNSRTLNYRNSAESLHDQDHFTPPTVPTAQNFPMVRTNSISSLFGRSSSISSPRLNLRNKDMGSPRTEKQDQTSGSKSQISIDTRPDVDSSPDLNQKNENPCLSITGKQCEGSYSLPHATSTDTRSNIDFSPHLNEKDKNKFYFNTAEQHDNSYPVPSVASIDARSGVGSSPRENPTALSPIFHQSPVNSSSKEVPTTTRNISSSGQSSTQVSPSLTQDNVILSPKHGGNEQENTSHWIEALKSVESPKDASESSSRVLRPASENSPLKSCLPSLKTPIEGSAPGLSRSSPSKAVTFVSSSPMASSPLGYPLSPTTWTRSHWILLAKTVQHWKPVHYSTSTASTRRTSPLRPRNSTRVISKLLGRNVSSRRGHTMKLEQWHLEAIDEFRSIVPGWDERDVAKRVFALMIGEKIRQGMKRETTAPTRSV